MTVGELKKLIEKADDSLHVEFLRNKWNPVDGGWEEEVFDVDNVNISDTLVLSEGV